MPEKNSTASHDSRSASPTGEERSSSPEFETTINVVYDTSDGTLPPIANPLALTFVDTEQQCGLGDTHAINSTCTEGRKALGTLWKAWANNKNKTGTAEGANTAVVKQQSTSPVQ